MFNEAVILVLFSVLTNKSSTSQFSDSISLFVRLSFGGLALGIAFSIGLAIAIKRMLNDFFLETNTALILAYLLFWVCEKTTVHVSGALALVTYGLFMSAYGKTLISPSIEDQFKEFLELISRNIESMVFIIAGLLFGNTAYYSPNLDTKDMYTLFLLFPLTYLIRFIVLCAHYPILSHSGYGLTWKELIALNFAGMKGVISTSLALIVSGSETITDEHFKAIAVYFGIGTAGLSIIIGGLITRISVRLLGLEDLTDVQENMLIGITSALVDETDRKIKELENDKDCKLIKWDEVLEFVGSTPLARSILIGSKIGAIVLQEHPHAESQTLLQSFLSKFQLSKSVLATEMRRRYLATLKGVYWEKFEEGHCHGTTSLLLIDSCNMCLDLEQEPMKDWTLIRQTVHNDKRVKIFHQLSKIPVIGHYFRRQLYHIIRLAYDSANTFINCHKETEKLIDEMEIDMDKNVFEEVMSEAHKQVKACEQFLTTYIIDCYPEVLSEVQTKRCSKLLLYSQRQLIHSIYEDGIISEIEFDKLVEAIDASIREVTFQGIPKIPLLQEILTNRFTSASDEEILQLIEKISERKYEPGAIIFTEGHPADGAYYILRGRVHEYSSWIDQELIIGNICGVQHLLEEFSYTNTSSATVNTSSILVHLPKEILQIEGFVEDMYSEAREELILLNRARYQIIDVKEIYVLRFIQACQMKNLKKGKKVVFAEGAIIMKGKVFEEQKGWVINPSITERDIIEDCIVLLFPVDFSLIFNDDISLSDAIIKFCVKIKSNYVITKKDSFINESMNINDSKLEEDSALFLKQELAPTPTTIVKFKSRVHPEEAFADND